MLSRLGCDVEVAEDGQAAVERVTSAAPGYFDLVLMDCQMPVMDGYEATRRIRDYEGHSTSRLPILALTASALHGDRERGLEAGMDDYLTKPIRMDDVRNFLSRWLPAAAREVAADEKAEDPVVEPEPLGDALDADAALQQVAGDWDLLLTVANLFLDGWTELHDRLLRAVKEDDAAELAAVAHRLKGGSGNVGAKALHSLAGELELRWKAGDTAEASADVARLERRMEAYREALDGARVEAGV
jgi:CheY-like chemotaxis protein